MIGIFRDQLLSCFDQHAYSYNSTEILSSLEVLLPSYSEHSHLL